MTDRPPAAWMCVYSVAVLAELAAVGVVWGLFANGVAKPLALVLVVPGVWLIGGLLLGRDAGPRLAAVNGFTAGVLLLANLSMLQHVTARWSDWWVPGPGACHGYQLDYLGLGQFPLALAVLLANVVGRWRRRPDWRTDPEEP